MPFTGLEETPRPEDIASALHLKRADVVSNWETRSGVEGFLAKFLMDQAQLSWDNLDFQAFEDILALLIYGLVLFPNLDSFIDVNAVKIFLSRNLVVSSDYPKACCRSIYQCVSYCSDYYSSYHPYRRVI